MGFDFSFRQLDTLKDLKILTNFLIKQSLGYPNYEDWVLKSEAEIDCGYKSAILAFSKNQLIGDLVYQPHKELPRFRELKNMRVHPIVRQRYFASFMLRQAETENKNAYDAIICDVRTDQPEVINLLRITGYEPILKTPLYDKNIDDIVMIKTFNKTSRQGILYKAKENIARN
ncbi:MAG: hypothetical protein ABIC91_02380 [Nanoarchaeota archaeon]|nr:hypothetical protein [Nanoarchaeota archaeon]MBU1030115.1 hypothetical protein [Nanoarchaeota archaeon]MBU1849998.1 hypothetical protein [Nanoarchaeota archaeon]